MEGAERVIMIKREDIDENVLISLGKRDENWQIVEDIKNDLNTQKEDYANYQNDNNLKIASVERELNNYKSTMAGLNPNQEAKQKASGYGVVNLPPNAANGQVSIVVKGETRTNIVKGEFTNTYQTINIIPNNLYYISVENILNATSWRWRMKFYKNGVDITNSIVLSNISSLSLYLHPSNYIAETVNGTNKTFYFNNIDADRIDIMLTLGDTTSSTISVKAMIEQGVTSRGQYISSGTKSTPSASRLKSVGKNLWNLDKEWKIKETIDGFVSNKINGYLNATTLLPSGSSKVPIKINEFKQSTRYTVQAKVKGSTLSLRIYYIDGTDETINWSSSNFVTKIGTTLTGKTVKAISFSTGNPSAFAYIAEGTLQLEEGTVATPYEPYTESTSYLPNVGELRSLPNGTKDEIRVSGGKAEYIKRIDDDGAAELASPIVIPINVSGGIVSNPSGTIYIEPVVADAGIYIDKLNVLNTDLPINYIEKLSKVDFNTGVETELDTSQCVIAEDKLSFTHPDLTANDIVFFTYFHNLEGTQGEIAVEYYDSRHTLKDSVTGKFYKIVPTVSDGVLTNQLVEV